MTLVQQAEEREQPRKRVPHPADARAGALRVRARPKSVAPRPPGRVIVAFGLPFVALVCALVACADRPKVYAPDTVPSVRANDDDVRKLTRKDCEALRDHLVQIAIEHALSDAGPHPDSGDRLRVEDTIRAQLRLSSESWIERCVGRRLRGPDLRCMKEATTPESFNRCGEDEPDIRSDAGRSD